jgi:hypothetical protein
MAWRYPAVLLLVPIAGGEPDLGTGPLFSSTTERRSRRNLARAGIGRGWKSIPEDPRPLPQTDNEARRFLISAAEWLQGWYWDEVNGTWHSDPDKEAYGVLLELINRFTDPMAGFISHWDIA